MWVSELIFLGQCEMKKYPILVHILGLIVDEFSKNALTTHVERVLA